MDSERHYVTISAIPLSPYSIPAPTLASAKQSKPRPKLTFETLKQSSGLPEVYHNFPAAFKHQFRGRGHEASDLRRLLELYKRWQDRIFPHCSFDNFIASMEKLGSTNVVANEMNEMRADLLKQVDDYLAPTAPQAEEADEYFQALAPADNNDDHLEEDIDYDDELLELAAAPMDAGGEVPQPLGDTTNNDDADDDELLELAMQGVACNVGEAPMEVRNQAEDDFDDDELLEMAMQS